ncbi:unnamed protein product, partial [Rotaria sp. Silwood1]
MAFGRGHASFTIDILRLAKDSLPATVTEPSPVYPELLNTPHPLIENPINDYDYKLKLKLNFNSSFRTLHDPKKDDHEKNFILNKWKEEWSILHRELKQASRININASKTKPNLIKKDIETKTKKKKTTFNIDLKGNRNWLESTGKNPKNFRPEYCFHVPLISGVFRPVLFDLGGIVFSQPWLISTFLQLETLILDNISAQSLNNVADHLIILPKLHSLTINNIGYIQNSTLYYIRILRLPKLKYCKIKFESKDDVELLPKSTDIFSPIECLVINHYFRLQSLNNLLSYLQQLRHLSINYLNGFDLQHIEFYPIVLKNLKYISLELDLVSFDQLEKFIKNFFYYVEVLRLTIKADFTYFDAKKMGTINKTVKSGIFYSTNPYRRKDYTFYWEFDEQVCSYIQENNLNSVKHLHICSNAISDICINYFSNVTELTITNSFQISVDPVSKTLSRIVALKQITKLVVEPYDFYFEELIDLLRCTSNLYTLKYDLICFHQNTATSIQQKEEFLHLSNINKVKRLDIRETCTLEEIKML